MGFLKRGKKSAVTEKTEQVLSIRSENRKLIYIKAFIFLVWVGICNGSGIQRDDDGSD